MGAEARTSIADETSAANQSHSGFGHRSASSHMSTGGTAVRDHDAQCQNSEGMCWAELTDSHTQDGTPKCTLNFNHNSIIHSTQNKEAKHDQPKRGYVQQHTHTRKRKHIRALSPLSSKVPRCNDVKVLTIFGTLSIETFEMFLRTCTALGVPILARDIERFEYTGFTGKPRHVRDILLNKQTRDTRKVTLIFVPEFRERASTFRTRFRHARVNSCVIIL